MSEKEKALPLPPSTPFGSRRGFEQEGDSSRLIADQLAMAMAEGKLDEYIKQEMSDNEHARKLTQMMMGMSGISGMPLPGFEHPPVETGEDKPSGCCSGAAATESKSPVQVPEDLVKAALDGDLGGVMHMLRREHEKNRSGATASEARPAPSLEQRGDAGEGGSPAIEKEVLDALASIARDNSLTLDWLILRSLKLYVQEYKKSGRL